MNDQLKPTTNEIAQYIYEWIAYFDGHGLVITDDDSIQQELKQIGDRCKFQNLREMFTPYLYNTIREYVDNQE